jgi:hypothetical protein
MPDFDIEFEVQIDANDDAGVPQKGWPFMYLSKALDPKIKG